MNRDLQTWLHALESGSIKEDTFREILNFFQNFTSYTFQVSDNRTDTAIVYCRILSICQNLYDNGNSKVIPREIIDQLINTFSNIEQLYHEISEEERKGTYVRTIWFLSELKAKSAEGRAGEIDKRIIGEYAKDLLDVFQDIRFVFDIKSDGKLLFPISQVIAAILKGRASQKFIKPIELDDIYTLHLAVKLFQQPEDTEILNEIKTKCSLIFIDYLNDNCLIIDTRDFLNYRWNGVNIFYNHVEHKVLIRASKKEYFSKNGKTDLALKTESDYDGNPIGYFVEYTMEDNDTLSDFSDILKDEKGCISFLYLLFDQGARNVFLQYSIIRKKDGSLMPINPYCTNDKRIVKGYLEKKDGSTYQLNQIRDALQKYRTCSVKTNVMNRVTLGLCAFLLDTNNIGVDELGIDSLTENDWYQSQIIQNWLNHPDVTDDHISLMLNEWYKQLFYCCNRTKLEEEEIHEIDFLPLSQNLKPIYEKIYPDISSDEKLFSGIVHEDEGNPENYTIEVNESTITGKEEKGNHRFPIVIPVDNLKVKGDSLKWDLCVGSEVYFFYSLSRNQGYALTRELLKALAGVETIQLKSLAFNVGSRFFKCNYDTICSLTKLYEISYEEAAHKRKICPRNDIERQTYLRLLHNMVWSEINTTTKLDSYLRIFSAHQIADFSDVDRDSVFQREDPNTLYVPKDGYKQSSVLEYVYDQRIKSSIERDCRNLYETELGMVDEQYTIFDNPIKRIVLLTDNCARGSSTIAALAAYLGIESDAEFHIYSDRVKMASATRHPYYYQGSEVTISEIIRKNNATITVHSYYGTEDAKERIDKFLAAHVSLHEPSSYYLPLENQADENIIEEARNIWGSRENDIPKGCYLYVREYNMPRKSIFPESMLKPYNFISLFVRKEELNELKRVV